MADAVRDPRFFEDALIKFLYTNVSVREKVMPFLRTNIFDRKTNQNIITHVFNFTERFNKFPSVQESKLDIDDEKSYEHLLEILDTDLSDFDDNFLLHEIETFMKKKMIYNICTSTVVNLDEKNGLNAASVDEMREAYSFSFDDKIGMDIMDDEDRMYEFFHSDRNFVETGIKNFDRLIDGGFHSKSLNLILAACVTKDTMVRIRVKRT